MDFSIYTVRIILRNTKRYILIYTMLCPFCNFPYTLYEENNLMFSTNSLTLTH